MRLATLPLPKPYQEHNQRQPEESYVQPGDYIETPLGEGEVEETRYGANWQQQFRLEGSRRWFDEKTFLNHLDHAGYLYSRRYEST